MQANATNTVALWPGLGASAAAYLKRLNVSRRLLVPLLLTSVAGLGGRAAAARDAATHFPSPIPWLLLGGTVLFAFGNKIRTIAGKAAVVNDLSSASWRAITLMSTGELLVAAYGGYFGAGIGFIILEC